MPINVRTKGQTGEREVAKILNDIVNEQRELWGYPELAVEDYYFQRNQNQSAVGGDDLTSPMPLAFEVKRQEKLSVNTWWKQCTASANRTGYIPILIYRQNRKPWKVRMYATIPVEVSGYRGALYNNPVELDLDTFKAWFTEYTKRWLLHHA
ncbi:endonuclease [Alteromonas phage vB_AcoS-R7M]|uniref:Endonuclease n=1 Tax=Alteromonas phage vB_AcoS-R7M TaxID=2729541 RepID=A0A6M3YNB7_9CAUD|nr:RusA-like Holliday junction resolvase [Alteromonas phage vB_AcoS-R7M]QJI53337.1 endonuclease [Alteromonas phage vB_AcoS-R7M]